MVNQTMALLRASTDPTAGNDLAELIEQSAEVPAGVKSNFLWLVFAVIAAAIVIGALILLKTK